MPAIKILQNAGTVDKLVRCLPGFCNAAFKRSFAYDCLDPVLQLLAEVITGGPKDMVKLPGIEVNIVNDISAARPNHRYPKSVSKSSLEIHSTTCLVGITDEVGDYETASSDSALVSSSIRFMCSL